MEIAGVIIVFVSVVMVLIGVATELEKTNKALIRIACALEQQVRCMPPPPRVPVVPPS